jgi:hypothetical protein
MAFDIVSPISEVVRIAGGPRLRQGRRLIRDYGPGDWVKRKGAARVSLPDGTIQLAEIHWYEAH